MSDNFNYNEFLSNAKANSAKTTDFSKSPFEIGSLKKDNSMNVASMDKPSQVGHSYVDNNYYKQNEAYNNLSDKVGDYTFYKTFDKAMGKDAGSNIESSKAINAAVKQSKGSVNELVPELMSKVSENVDSTIDNVTSFFQNKLDNMSNQEIMNYAKISDMLAQKAGLDTQMETDLLKAWSINKEMEYSLQGLDKEKDAFLDSQFYNNIQTAVNAVATIVGCIAAFF